MGGGLGSPVVNAARYGAQAIDWTKDFAIETAGDLGGLSLEEIGKTMAVIAGVGLIATGLVFAGSFLAPAIGGNAVRTVGAVASKIPEAAADVVIGTKNAVAKLTNG